MDYNEEWAYVVSRIKYYREAKGWSLQALADNANIDRANISKIESSVTDREKGKKSVKDDVYFSTLFKIAEALGVALSDLVR